MCARRREKRRNSFRHTSSIISIADQRESVSIMSNKEEEEEVQRAKLAEQAER